MRQLPLHRLNAKIQEANMRVLLISALLIAACVLAQTQLKPCVTDNGGGFTYGDSIQLVSSIGQSVSGISSATRTLEAGYVTGALGLTAIEEHYGKPPRVPTIGEFFPNPFNSATKIELEMPEPGDIELSLFDIAGKMIYTWREHRNAGVFTMTFTAAEELPAGTYLYRITACRMQKMGKIAFVK